VGKSVDDLKPGDHVIADFHARGGLWRQRAIHDRNELIPIDRRIDLVSFVAF
jgi:NADPH:quinone reductase-like Zn-dependent oxidoreductase